MRLTAGRTTIEFDLKRRPKQKRAPETKVIVEYIEIPVPAPLFDPLPRSIRAVPWQNWRLDYIRPSRMVGKNWEPGADWASMLEFERTSIEAKRLEVRHALLENLAMPPDMVVDALRRLYRQATDHLVAADCCIDAEEPAGVKFVSDRGEVRIVLRLKTWPNEIGITTPGAWER